MHTVIKIELHSKVPRKGAIRWDAYSHSEAQILRRGVLQLQSLSPMDSAACIILHVLKMNLRPPHVYGLHAYYMSEGTPCSNV